ncbi:MAG TPA: Nif3-like dinuclear metal center hexameric protein [Candidatus Lokiarchaeia archaeon]|nr:Nif3-like dinuclear metal center hexameric protein [Candidatus Lokiarchaeia archaeon]
MLLSRIFEKLQNLSSNDFATTWDLTRVEIHFTKLNSDFLVKRALLSPEISFASVLEAKQLNANLIITPASLFQSEMHSLEYHQVDIWRLLLSQRICCIHLGSEWINSNNGFSMALLNILGLNAVDLFMISDLNSNQRIPVGRIASFTHPFQGDFSDFVTSHVPQASVLNSQDCVSSITNVAVIPIQNIPSSVIYQALDCGCEALIGGEYSPNAIQAAEASGLNLYSIPLQETAQIGLTSLTRLLAVEYPNEEFSYFTPS